MSQISRKKSRKFLFQKLFAETFSKFDEADFRDSFLVDSYKWHIDEEYVVEMEKIIKENEDKLIELIKMYAPKFSPEKMILTYVIPIFIWASEMLYYKEEIPAKVSINEAIELAKTYWDDSARRIVNWVLHNLLKNYDEIKEKLDNLEKKEDSFSFFKN